MDAIIDGHRGTTVSGGKRSRSRVDRRSLNELDINRRTGGTGAFRTHNSGQVQVGVAGYPGYKAGGRGAGLKVTDNRTIGPSSSSASGGPAALRSPHTGNIMDLRKTGDHNVGHDVLGDLHRMTEDQIPTPTSNKGGGAKKDLGRDRGGVRDRHTGIVLD